MTPGELKDVENRSRYRRYLRTQYHKPTPHPRTARPRIGSLVNAFPQPEPALVGTEDEVVTPTRSAIIDLYSGEDEPTRSELDAEAQEAVPPTTLYEPDLPPLRSAGRGVLSHHRSVSDAQSDAAIEALSGSDGTSEVESDSENNSSLVQEIPQRRRPRKFPPPFSTVPRAVSSVGGKLSQASGMTRHLDIESSSPPQDGNERRVGSPSRTYRIMSAVRSLGSRATRSPRQHSSVYENPDVSNLSAGEILAATEPRARTPALPVDNDGLPGTAQPQTPRHLPESHRQGRFEGAYTAPAGTGSQARNIAEQSPTRARGRQPRRNGSPVGFRLPGFLGLYGGSENADDQQ
ncbi:Fc.00g029930.m01.CDS01 [Cosmosporella sp. VM-42]